MNITTSAAKRSIFKSTGISWRKARKSKPSSVCAGSGLGLKQSKDIIDALESGEDSTAASALLGGLLPDQTAGDVLQVISAELLGQAPNERSRWPGLRLPAA